MDNILIGSLFFFEIAILFIFLKKFKQLENNGLGTSQSNSEQQLVLKEMHHKVETELRIIHQDAKKMIVELQKIATFKEIEVRKQKEVVHKEMEELSSEFRGSIEQILHQLDQQHDKLISSKAQTEETLQDCQKAVAQAEILVSGLDKKLPFDEVLNKLERKKFEQARRLMVRGKSAQEIASATGLNLSQVDMIVHAN